MGEEAALGSAKTERIRRVWIDRGRRRLAGRTEWQRKRRISRKAVIVVVVE